MVRSVAFGVVLLLAAASASAAPILQVNGTVLIGATGVDVGGTLYDVAFVDGSCAAEFTGCNDASDFAFTTSAAASAAAQALLDQVFLDVAQGNFDTTPGLTFGCLGPVFCDVAIPYATSAGAVTITGAHNDASPALDQLLGSVAVSVNTSFTTFTGANLARFTPAAVPEPVSMTLLGLGLAGLGAQRWRQRRRVNAGRDSV